MKIPGLFLFALIALLSHSSMAEADKGSNVLLRPSEIRALIGDYPAVGSEEEARDDDILISLQETRTKSDCILAASQSKLKIERVFVKPIGPLEDDEYDSIKFRLLKLQAVMLVNIFQAKRMYDRPRPYVRNSSIKPCIPLETSSSYPSGHSALGRATGKLLAHYFPDRADEIMKVADQVGTNRMVGGVHHPSDVIAGRKLGDGVVLEMILDRD